MKLILSKLTMLCISFLLVNTQSFAEESYENLQWQNGPKTQNILGKATIFIPAEYQFLGINETDKYLKLSKNIPSGAENFFSPKDFSWESYFSFDELGYVKDDVKIDANELLAASKESSKKNNKYRVEQGWDTLSTVGWQYPPRYNPTNNQLEWAFLLVNDNTNEYVINYHTRILGKNGVMAVILVAYEDNLAQSVIELSQHLSTFKFNPGEKYSEYKKGDKVAEFGLAALIVGGAAAVASKKGVWAILMGLLLAAKKFAIVIIIALFAGIASLFKRKK
jgi:uncharacterized membrane-anchored protein